MLPRAVLLFVPDLLNTVQCTAVFESHIQQPLQHPQPRAGSACQALHQDFPFQTIFPGETVYEDGQRKYWIAQQSDLSPACRFLAFSAQDVSHAVRTLTSYCATFAVVSGGHSSNVNASNIDDGVTIDLSGIHGVALTDNDSAAWLGVGERWHNVYSPELEAKGLVVPGGRVANVGVGGYVLGGGLSWFANRLGWTCDGVLEFELVTPNTSVLIINAATESELFWALKGSLGAYGIVTRIKVPTVRNTGIYGGSIGYHQSQLPRVFRALQQLSYVSSEDLGTQGYISLGWTSNDGEDVASIVAYLVSTESGEHSPGVHAFQRIPSTHSTMRHMVMRESADEAAEGNLPGMRRRRFTLTLYSRITAMEMTHQICTEAVSRLHLRQGEMFGVAVQPIAVPMMKAGHQKNVLDLDSSSGPLLLILVEFWWDDVRRDRFFEQQADGLWGAMKTAFDDQDLLHPFVYPNYAWEKQNPFAKLSRETRQRLRTVRTRYDQSNVWKTLRPGIWHPD